MRRRISWMIVVVSLAPVQPSGCPRAIAPPLTLRRSGSIGSSRRHASTCAAKASFSSTGPICVERQPGPLQRLLDRRHRPDAEPLRLDARGGVADEARQRRQAELLRADSADVTTTAAAPSLVCDELPAVTVPAAWKAGLQLGQRLRRRVAARPFVLVEGHDLADAVVASPRSHQPGRCTGTSSSAKRPASMRGQRALVAAQREGVLFLAA